MFAGDRRSSYVNATTQRSRLETGKPGTPTVFCSERTQSGLQKRTTLPLFSLIAFLLRNVFHKILYLLMSNEFIIFKQITSLIFKQFLSLISHLVDVNRRNMHKEELFWVFHNLKNAEGS